MDNNTLRSDVLRARNQPNRLRALTGWPLEAALVLDEAAGGGFLRASCSAGQQWRQAFAAALAGGLLNHPDLFLRRTLGSDPGGQSWSSLACEVAALLPLMRPREIVEAGLGTCPDGYLGALGKLGVEPMSADAYVRLLDLFTSSNPEVKKRSRVVRELPALSESQLAAIEVLDAALLHPAVARFTRTSPQAEALNSALTLIRSCCSSATYEAVQQSLSVFGTSGQPRWVRNWLAKADIGSVALQIDDPEIEVVHPGNAGRVAKSYSNCLGAMATKLLVGTWAAVVYRPAELILTFSKLADDRWVMTGVYARANATVSAESRERARLKVRQLGPRFILAAETPVELQGVAGMIDPFGFDQDLDDLPWP